MFDSVLWLYEQITVGSITDFNSWGKREAALYDVHLKHDY